MEGPNKGIMVTALEKRGGCSADTDIGRSCLFPIHLYHLKDLSFAVFIDKKHASFIFME